MSTVNWGVLFGILSLIILQASFAVGAVLLFFAVKQEVQRAKDIYSNHLRETDTLKTLTTSLGKKIERYEAKIEELKAVKIDGWEDADTELAKKIRTVNARVSAIYSKIAREAEEEEPGAYQPDLYPDAGPVPAQPPAPEPTGGLDASFGRSINGSV